MDWFKLNELFSSKIKAKQKFKSFTGAGSKRLTTRNGKNKIKFRNLKGMSSLLPNSCFIEQKIPAMLRINFEALNSWLNPKFDYIIKKGVQIGNVMASKFGKIVI